LQSPLLPYIMLQPWPLPCIVSQSGLLQCIVPQSWCHVPCCGCTAAVHCVMIVAAPMPLRRDRHCRHCHRVAVAGGTVSECVRSAEASVALLHHVMLGQLASVLRLGQMHERRGGRKRRGGERASMKAQARLGDFCFVSLTKLLTPG
jgi:hypothetical protein